MSDGVDDRVYGELVFFKRLCLRTREREGLSARYWRARQWLDAALLQLRDRTHAAR